MPVPKVGLMKSAFEALKWGAGKVRSTVWSTAKKQSQRAAEKGGQTLDAGKQVFRNSGLGNIKDAITKRASESTSFGMVYGAATKAGKPTAKAAIWAAGLPIRHPRTFIAGAVGAGSLYGFGSAALQLAEQRTIQLQQNRGLPSNNLGTDGLTLSLSKLRHR